jgi:hypothetical protein
MPSSVFFEIFPKSKTLSFKEKTIFAPFWAFAKAKEAIQSNDKYFFILKFLM